MSRAAQDLVGLNIINGGAGLVAFLLLMSWGRAVRGSWPGRRKMLIFVGYILVVIVACNGLYFYFRSH